MDNKYTIVYVMRHIDSGGHIDIPYKKVGITGSGSATLTSRLQQISSTKSPIKAQCIAAWEHHDAKEIENAIHSLLEENRVEGEWFYDKDDSLVERMEPIMKLLKARAITIEGSEDNYTKSILKKESDSKSASNKTLLGEISELLKEPLRSSIRLSGPTFFSDKTNLTYYISHRKSGNHKLHIGRSKGVYKKLYSFLENQGYDAEKSLKGDVIVNSLTKEDISNLINIVEAEFHPN